MDEFTEPFDITVAGTGLVGSILAAAFARNGKRVLHIDENDVYGDLWSTVRANDLASFAERNDSLEEFTEWRSEALKPRQVNIDITPKVCSSRGSLVKLLLSSNTSRYLEFKPVANLFSHDGSQLSMVPFNKSSLMKARSLPPRDKRVLVRYLQACKSDADKPELATLSYSTHLQQTHGLSEGLARVVMHELLWVADDINAADATALMLTFLASLGVYSPTPYIAVMYGIGEVAQAFCRLCAVFGGIYMLRTDPLSLPPTPNEDGSYTLSLGQATVTTKRLLVGSRSSTTKMSRLVVVLSDLPPDIPVDAASSIISMTIADVTVRALVQPGDLGLVDATQCVVHFWTQTSDTALDTLQQALETLLGDLDRNSVLYKASFVMPCASDQGLKDDQTFQDLPTLVATLDDAIDRAAAIFALLCPDEPFLPAAPNPEDLIFESDPVITPITTAFQTQYFPLEAYAAVVQPDKSTARQLDCVDPKDVVAVMAQALVQRVLASLPKAVV
eukprot:m.90381 g.90381  ORF g.90381 m.90381 type:complete len:503 (+) comp14880_c0_seq1:98-1606(+)